VRSIVHFRGSALSIAKHCLQAAVGGLKSGLGTVKSLVSQFMALPGRSKLMALVVVVLAVALVFVLRLTVKGRSMPEMGPGFLTSFEDVADQKFEYDPHETMEEFNNPLLHPENVVQLEKIVVNLAQPEDGSNPMGMFELYVETSSHESAIEIKDREIEARDTVARTLEQMRYDDLITLEGKNKLKLMIRKNLNTLLTQGRVRKVFFKTVVLKP
jgi:flagellar basal body-associated protein FliL